MKEGWEIHWKDYFSILQIHPLAEPEVVKAAYDRLARKYHPDKNPSVTSEKMKDLNEAFEIISNTSKRAQYYTAYLEKTNPHSSTPSPPPKTERKAAQKAAGNTSSVKDQRHSPPDVQADYDKNGEHVMREVFTPAFNDNVAQKQLKFAKAIEYILLKTTKFRWLEKRLLQQELRSLKYKTYTSDELIKRIKGLEHLQAWSNIFTQVDGSGYYTTRKKATNDSRKN